MAKRKNLEGQIFGRLAVLRPKDEEKLSTFWACQCSCGATVTVKSTALTRGRKKSCGCLQKESRRQNFQNRVRSKYPETPSPLPAGAAKIFKEYRYLIDRLLDQRGAVDGLEDVANDLLIRASWIAFYRAEIGNPIADMKAYFCSYLFLDRAMIRLKRNRSRMERLKTIGSTMAIETLNCSTIQDSADISLGVFEPRRLKRFSRK